MFIYEVQESVYLFWYSAFLTHTITLLFSMSGLWGKTAKAAAVCLAKKTTSNSLLEKESRMMVDYLAKRFSENSLLSKETNEVLKNLIKNFKTEDVKLIGLSIIGGTIFSAVVYGSGTIYLIVKIGKIIWRCFQ